jgi:hypothetical protein
MAERRLAVVLMAAVGGWFLAGCECNRDIHPGMYDNFSGADWRHTVAECAYGYDAACDNWSGRAVASLSPLTNNVDGSDWRHTVKECGYGWDASFDRWWGRAMGSVSGLNSNLSGTDWRDYVAGSCGPPAGVNPPPSSGQP